MGEVGSDDEPTDPFIGRYSRKMTKLKEEHARGGVSLNSRTKEVLSHIQMHLTKVSNLVWFFMMTIRVSPKSCGLVFFLSIFDSLLVPFQLFITRHLVDAFVNEAFPIRLLIGLVVLLLVQRIIGSVLPYVQAELSEDLGIGMQRLVMKKSAQVKLIEFENRDYFDRISLICNGSESRGAALLQQITSMMRIIPGIIAYAIVVAGITPILLAIILVAMIPVLIDSMLIGVKGWEFLRRINRQRRLSDYYSTLLTTRRFAQEVRLYDLGSYFISKWEELFTKTTKQQMKFSLLMLLRQRATVIFMVFVSMAGLWWVVFSGIAQATPGQYAILFQSILGLLSGASIAGILRGIGEQSGYALQLRSFLSMTTVDDSVEPGHQREVQGKIVFENVTFTYPGSSVPAIKDLSVSINAGESLAVVGENGAGKTTFVKLLLGLYAPDSGRILIDGVDINNQDEGIMLKSAVFQDFVRYNAELRTNIGISDWRKMDNDILLEDAVKKAGADEVMSSLSEGYETLLGPEVGGVDLSGGQWQRTAMARGLFRDAQIIVLDEPTASLDPITELSIFERFSSMTQGKTTILISHRLGMARLADRIIVLERGKLVEYGDHDSLIKLGGKYAELFNTQARWYR
jgi:ATP-binding cassette subfamily B protein